MKIRNFLRDEIEDYSDEKKIKEKLTNLNPKKLIERQKTNRESPLFPLDKENATKSKEDSPLKKPNPNIENFEGDSDIIFTDENKRDSFSSSNQESLSLFINEN